VFSNRINKKKNTAFDMLSVETNKNEDVLIVFFTEIISSTHNLGPEGVKRTSLLHLMIPMRLLVVTYLSDHSMAIRLTREEFCHQKDLDLTLKILRNYSEK
jgi:hypothetical protein